MKCSNCGAENAEGFKFCETCGTPSAEHKKNIVDSYVPIAERYPKETKLRYQNIEQPTQPPEQIRVVVTDFDMPFGSLVNFMVKVALASIRAAIVIALIYGVTIFCILTSLSVLGVAVRR